MASKITSWSFSRWNVYETCPAQAKYKFIDKLPEEEGPALARGTAIHAKAASYVDARKGALPLELKLLKDYFQDLRKLGGASELQWAFDSSWQRVEWFSKDAWCRVMIDRFVYATPKKKTARVVDYKTGKIRGEYVEQLELYQVAGLLGDPEANEVAAELAFVDQGKILPEKPAIVKKAQLAKLQKKWEQRVKPMLNDTVFAPRPGNHCRFCSFSSLRKGPCRY